MKTVFGQPVTVIGAKGDKLLVVKRTVGGNHDRLGPQFWIAKRHLKEEAK